MKINRPIPPLHHLTEPLGLLGRERRDVGQNEHVGGFEPRREEVLLLNDLDPPGLGRADADRQGAAR